MLAFRYFLVFYALYAYLTFYSFMGFSHLFQIALKSVPVDLDIIGSISLYSNGLWFTSDHLSNPRMASLNDFPIGFLLNVGI